MKNKSKSKKKPLNKGNVMHFKNNKKVQIVFNKRQKKEIFAIINDTADSCFQKEYQMREWENCRDAVKVGIANFKIFLNKELEKKGGSKMFTRTVA